MVFQSHDVKMTMEQLHRPRHLHFLGDIERIPPPGTVGIVVEIPQARRSSDSFRYVFVKWLCATLHSFGPRF
ncbi:hypothetical protein ACHAW5_007419 [Stephanodiscus triporus]|uniref:Uncharacterized protein n=1 Tax=Stephanodiscus triporus TaxID=2934178 RepID=A0ABD3QEH4_9STRA